MRQSRVELQSQFVNTGTASKMLVVLGVRRLMMQHCNQNCSK